MEDIRLEGQAGDASGSVMTAVVVDGGNGKEYPAPDTRRMIDAAAEVPRTNWKAVFETIPVRYSQRTYLRCGEQSFSDRCRILWFQIMCAKLFTPRQLLALGTFVNGH